ncbi:MAG TPA: protoporphyrinogen oxidase, partial [Actinomycetota bacterium]|nr:protoporphyrinogen oxidase [Actinomycetota bacterium]
LGLEGDLVAPAVSGALLIGKASKVAVPPGFVRGVPPGVRAAWSCGALSRRGALRTAVDYVLPGPLRGDDVSLASLVRRRLGREVLERLVEPMLAASRSGSPEDVSLASGAPELDEIARSSRSLMRGVRRRGPVGAPELRGISGGMERLVAALVEDLQGRGAEVRTETRAEAVVRKAEAWSVATSAGTVAADAVLVAAPPPRAAGLLAEVAPAAAALLAEVSFEDAAVVGLAYPAGAAPAPPGASGIIVTREARRLITACAWFSSKWPHVSPPGGPDVIRAFVGPDGARLPETELVARAAVEVASLTGAPATPQDAVVARWRNALPVLRVGHQERIRRARELLPEGVAVAGAGYDGSGLPDCIGSGARQADRLSAARR